MTQVEMIMAGGGSLGVAIAEAARRARRHRAGWHAADDSIVEVGADIAGQCLTAFLLWVRSRCEHEGIADAAFLARDGELPLRMARAMPADHWEGLDLRYLHASRRVWSLAAAAVVGVDVWMTIGTADDRSFLHHSRHLIPFGSLLGRLGLEPRDLTAHAPFAQLDPLRPLPAELDAEWRQLLADQAIRERVHERARARLQLLLEHLRELGVPQRRLALVDVGWRGQLAWLLSAMLRETTGYEPLHLHFGGADVASGVAGKVDIRRFAVDDSVAPLPFPEMVSCVETFTASGRPPARGLTRAPTGEVAMVFGPPVPEVDNDARRLLWDTAVHVAALMPSRQELDSEPHGAALDTEVRSILASFWTAPSPTHALAASRLGYEVDDAGTVIGPVAARYRLAEVRGGTAAAPRQWRQGSLQLTPQPQRTLVRALLMLRDRLRR